jgi:hypothetical protein
MTAETTTTAAGGSPVERGVGRMEPERTTGSLGLIHISWAGPERWLSAGGKQWCFEDHRYCGPIVLCNKTREPAKNEPPESHPFWQHVNAWYQQGKKTQEVGGKVWCVYETPLQQARKQARLKPPNHKLTGACVRSNAR